MFKRKQLQARCLGSLISLVSSASIACTICNTVSAEVVRSDNSADMNTAGIPLYEWKDTSVKEPKSIVIAIHGAAQQAGALDALARSLASIGYLVVAPDLRGAGRWNTLTRLKSTGTFGDFVRSCDDLSHLLSVLKKEYPKSHFFCIGESAGSTVVLSAMVHDASKVKGIILCSAGSEPKLHAPGTMGPEFYHKLMHVTTPVDMSQFIGHYSSDDSRVADEMIHDPLGRNKLSALELLGTFNFIQQGTVLAQHVPKSLPALLIQGKEDQIINADSSVRLLSNLDSFDKNILMLPNCGHILIGTSFVKPIVEESITDWLARHGGINATVSKAMPPSAPERNRDDSQSTHRSSNAEIAPNPVPSERLQPPLSEAVHGIGRGLVQPQDYGEPQAVSGLEPPAAQSAAANTAPTALPNTVPAVELTPPLRETLSP